jgi:glycosyltransferase involved in cell wall biosynthesis
MKRVVCVQERLLRYRVPFFDLLRATLAEDGVALDVRYGTASETVALRGDSADLPWGTYVSNRHVALGPVHEAVWQPVIAATRQADLVIVDQASRLLANYVLLVRQRFGGPPVALWGHGANLQPDGSLLSRIGEVAKRGYSRIPHWWFAYTEGTARRVAGLGFPQQRITVVQNAVDTSALQDCYDAVTPAEAARARAELGLKGRNTCMYIGSLYPNKRLGFLLKAAEMIATAVPDFELVVVGSGPDEEMVRRAAARFPWLHHIGASFGREKAVFARESRLLLMPGAVGLGILDSFSLRLPMVTTAEAPHGPEIEYLRDGENGLMTAPGATPEAYADTVINLMRDPARIARLRVGCAVSAGIYTVDAMASRFAGGVREALRQTADTRPVIRPAAERTP